jgi:hypothetical protein
MKKIIIISISLLKMNLLWINLKNSIFSILSLIQTQFMFFLTKIHFDLKFIVYNLFIWIVNNSKKK